MNYYEILEVSQKASQEVIRVAYKSLMQRYHPDRNPDNAEIALHASRVVQAYEVLSDLDKRAVYDIKLKQELSEPLSNIRDRNWNVQALSASTNRLVVKESKTYWFLWLLITLILSSGWLILSLSKKNQSSESEFKEIRLSFEGNQLTLEQRQAKLKRMDEIFRKHPEILKKEASRKAKELAARTIPIFITALAVNLRASETSTEGSGHVLSIPIIGAIVGSFDTQKVIRHIDSKTELIRQKLAEKLAYAKYEELIKIDGEQYLKKIILDSIGDTTGTNRYEDYPSSSEESPSRYGVVEILLPESFSVR